MTAESEPTGRSLARVAESLPVVEVVPMAALFPSHVEALGKGATWTLPTTPRRSGDRADTGVCPYGGRRPAAKDNATHARWDSGLKW